MAQEEQQWREEQRGTRSPHGIAQTLRAIGSVISLKARFFENYTTFEAQASGLLVVIAARLGWQRLRDCTISS